jgi:hypothetical protein
MESQAGRAAHIDDRRSRAEEGSQSQALNRRHLELQWFASLRLAVLLG